VRHFICKYILGVFALFLTTTSAAQQFNEGFESKTNSIIEEFNLFFEKEIRRQGVKGNWIFKLNEITGVHKFDYNSDGFIDSFLEFNAVPEEGGGVTLYFGVLFENRKNELISFIDYLKLDSIVFKVFEQGNFYFVNRDMNTGSSNNILFEIRANKFEALK